MGRVSLQCAELAQAELAQAELAQAELAQKDNMAFGLGKGADDVTCAEGNAVGCAIARTYNVQKRPPAARMNTDRTHQPVRRDLRSAGFYEPPKGSTFRPTGAERPT